LLHRCYTVREFDFENVFLINGGSWEDALAPLRSSSASDEWLEQQSGSEADGYSSFPSEDDLDQYDEEIEVIDTQNGLHYERPVEDILPRPSVLVTKIKKPRHRRRRRKHRNKPQPPEVSDLILPLETVEDFLKPTVFSPHVQGVQRNAQQEAAQQELADDPEKRISTLKKAKEAVLKQLGREFSRSHERKDHLRGFFKNTCSAGRNGRSFLGQESTTALVPLMFSRY